MKGLERRHHGSGMDLGKGRLLRALLAVVLVLLPACGRVEGQADGGASVIFLETPANVTSNTTAVFRWSVVTANGSNQCASNQCNSQCKLDNENFRNCSGQVAVYSNLTDGSHLFTVLVIPSRGQFPSNNISWTVDTVPPTAVLNTGASFTNEVNVSVNIKFSEPCILPGFQCPNISDCDAYVSGPGVILPSTLNVLKFGLEYVVTVALSTTVQSGKVMIRMAPPRENICVDQAGNRFVRNGSSILTVRFNRAIPTLNMWTPAQDSQVQINNEYQTISATKNSDDLRVYLDFSEPMDTDSETLLNALQISHGSLTPTTRKRNRRRFFAFSIGNVADFAIISISLPANSSINKYSTPVSQTSNVTFLYDNTPLGVSLSTTSLAKTKDHYIPFLIQFTKPVFAFGAGNVSTSGGNLTRFTALSKSTYTFELFIADDDAVSVYVRDRVTYDIAGNPNTKSNVLRIRHYTEPSSAVALYSFTTAGLIGTALASGALSISAAALAGAGALNSHTAGSATADPARNLLGMATHLQIFALADWLAVSLPVEFRETTRGLRWLIPHVDPPWQTDHNYSSMANPLLQQTVDPNEPIMRLKFNPGRRHLLGAGDDPFGQKGLSHTGEEATHRDTMNFLGSQDSAEALQYYYAGRRKLGPNMTAYGPALDPQEYTYYFDNDTSNTGLRGAFRGGDYTGWTDFARNMFWIGVVGGGLVLLHMLLLVFLRWRTRTSLRGALTIPRFELFLLILLIPCLCQASAFIIRGGTTLGIIIGVLLLAIPAGLLVSVILFLVIAILTGSLVQYKEVVVRRSDQQQQQQTASQASQTSDEEVRRFYLGEKVIGALTGKNTAAGWVRKEGLAPTFLPRYGLLFEDRKGPPKFIFLDGEVGGSFPKWVESGSNGVGRMRAVTSDDESDEASVPALKRILGGARAVYIVVDIARRIALGVLFGAFSRSDRSWAQVSLALAFTVAQLLYLVAFRPFIKRGVQTVESISLACETGLFVVAMVLLAAGQPSDNHLGAGIILLALLLISFVAQLVNEWYALMKQLLRLSPSPDPSLKEGLKMFGKGLVLPFVPRGQWGKLISPHQPPSSSRQQPRTSLVPPLPPSPEHPEMFERARGSSTSVHNSSPLIALGPEAAIPGYDLGSPAFIDPRNVVTEEVVSGEIRASSASAVAVAAAGAAAQKSGTQNGVSGNGHWGSQWSRSRSLEGKRSSSRAGGKADAKSSEMKMLRDIAKASFPRWRKHEEVPDPGLEISSPVHSNVGAGSRGATRNLGPGVAAAAAGGTGDDAHLVYTDDESSSDDSSEDDERYQTRHRRPQVVGESSIDVIGGANSLGVTPHSSSSFEKGSRGSGPLETTLSGGSLPLRELIQER